jgi:hypothetical protein
MLIVGGLTALNLVVLTINVSIQAQADVAGMSKMDLVRDRDFKNAVQYIVEDCKADGPKLRC